MVPVCNIEIVENIEERPPLSFILYLSTTPLTCHF